jgi:hypothetical protein
VVRVPGYRPRGSGFDSRRYQIFWEVVGLERGPLNLVRITEELLEWKSSFSGSRKPRLRPWGSVRWPRDTIYQLKLALTSPTGCGRSIGIVRLRTKTTEFVLMFCLHQTTRRHIPEARNKLSQYFSGGRGTWQNNWSGPCCQVTLPWARTADEK